MGKKLLFVNACARKESRTLRLAKELEKRIKDVDELLEVKLFEEELPILDEKRIAMRDRALMTGDYSDGYFDKAKDFAQADRIREELRSMGIELTDLPGGVMWKRV
jgi:FMN-dependent NADH-azoreductase